MASDLYHQSPDPRERPAHRGTRQAGLQRSRCRVRGAGEEDAQVSVMGLAVTIKRQLLQLAGIGRSSRSSHRRTPSAPRSRGPGFWTEASDTVLFKPHKSKTLTIWREAYRINREIEELERNQNRPPRENTILGWIGGQLRSAWGEFTVEVKALLTTLFFHLLTLVLIVVFNVVWFWLLWKIFCLWLDG
jgi:hypothetical protein